MNTPFHRTIPSDPKWIANALRQSFDWDGKSIYPLVDGFVIAEGGTWIPGAYATFEAAEAAFEFEDADLQALQARANARSPRNGGSITLDDLADALNPEHEPA